jgi:AraC-like DNA-binding protein
MPCYSENNDKTLSTYGFLSCLIDSAIAFGVDKNQLLKGTAIFYNDLTDANKRYSISQLLKVVENITITVNHSDELAIDVGKLVSQQLAMPVENLLQHSTILAESLAHVFRYQNHISPFFKLLGYNDGDYQFIVLQNRTGLAKAESFLANLQLSSLHILLNQCFTVENEFISYMKYAEPVNCAPLYKGVSHDICFDSPYYVLAIEQGLLAEPNSKRSPLAYQRFYQLCENYNENNRQPLSFVEQVNHYIFSTINSDENNIQQCAEYLQLSPASLKRKLKNNLCSFQVLNDNARTLLALKYIYVENMKNDKVAEALNFSDSKNFRRSFKRWTGHLPSDFKHC